MKSLRRRRVAPKGRVPAGAHRKTLIPGVVIFFRPLLGLEKRYFFVTKRMQPEAASTMATHKDISSHELPVSGSNTDATLNRFTPLGDGLDFN